VVLFRCFNLYVDSLVEQGNRTKLHWHNSNDERVGVFCGVHGTPYFGRFAHSKAADTYAYNRVLQPDFRTALADCGGMYVDYLLTFPVLTKQRLFTRLTFK